MIEQVATISANNDNVIGGLITNGKVKTKELLLQRRKGTDTTVEVVEGMVDRGYLSPYFITDQIKWKPSQIILIS